MNDSATITKPPMIYGKIADCIADIEAVGKNHRNQQQNYTFRAIDDFYDAMQPVLKKHRIFCAPTILEHKREERATKTGGILLTTITKVRFKIFAEDGSFIEADVLGEGADSGDKSANKAAAQAMKYLFMQVFAVRVNGEDHDTEKESHSYAPAKPAISKPHPPIKNASEGKPEGKKAVSGDVLPKTATVTTRDWAMNHLLTLFSDSEITNFLTWKHWADTTGWNLEHVPTTKTALNALSAEIGRWLEGSEPPPPEDELPTDIASVIITVPRKGTAKKVYLERPDTIGSLYVASPYDEDARKRLFGLANSWKPEPYEWNGKTYEPTEQDWKCREGLDAFLKWEEQRHGATQPDLIP